MGRHSASYIAEQHGLSTGPTAAGAAKYVGRVGALALAVGIGAAAAGGGTAHAEGPASSGGVGVQSSPKPRADTAAPAAPSTSGSAGVKTRKVKLSVPKTALDISAASTAHLSSRASSPTPVHPSPRASTRPDNPTPAVAKPATQNSVRLTNPIAAVTSGLFTALGFSTSASTGNPPVSPLQVVLGALQAYLREIEHRNAIRASQTAAFTSAQSYANANPAIASGDPTPGDETPTAYGDIGKWMLQPDGQISNYGGQRYDGKTLLETVNVIIVDPKSATPAAATSRLNEAMFWSGFPAQPIHSSGFLGTIDGTIYGQQPGFLQGYSDSFFLFPDDHGRMFGPDPVQTSTGYVWSGAFSSETLGFAGLPGHIYVSSDMARTALAMRLIASGQATFVGMVPLDNAYHTATYTTGDHDGYAVVLQLN
jgi:hypothetical protein